MITTTVTALSVATHAGVWAGAPFWPFFIVFPLLFLLVLGLIFGLVFRRRRFATYGPPWAGRASAEQILAERFARGEIEEAEYRARLETLRAR
ncbi:MAG: hypothetical protein QM626_12915 [Microbacterium sp.]|uniref:SHOCT domain-containing protein n=1 Tax=Microbacterium sp. TaxID=51671 RepID=UPI0039E66927